MEDATHYQITASRRVAAPAARVYDIIADYRNGHPNIVPSNFRNLQVEQGGHGAGTVVTFDVRSFGSTRSFRHRVEEPEPGRVLVERDADGPTRTTFTVERGASDDEARVTITTDMQSRPGLFGAIERTMTKSYLRKLYLQELANLEAFATRH